MLFLVLANEDVDNGLDGVQREQPARAQARALLLFLVEGLGVAEARLREEAVPGDGLMGRQGGRGGGGQVKGGGRW